MTVFVFDEIKNKSNLLKHGISLDDAKNLWNVLSVIIPVKTIGNEERFAILGIMNEKMYIAIYTLRGNSIRIISCHRADKKLERIYYEKI